RRCNAPNEPGGSASGNRRPGPCRWTSHAIAASHGAQQIAINSTTTCSMLARADLHAKEARELRGRTGRKRRLPPLLLGRLAGHDRRADEAATDPRQRLGRQARYAAGGERRARPLVVAAGRERGEDLPAEPARAGAVAGVAGAVVDTRARDGAEEGQVVGGHVDRAAPRPLDARVREVGQEPPQAAGSALRRRPVTREALVDAAAEA